MAALASRRLVATHLSGTQESTREYDQISSGLEPATSVLEAAARLGGREVALVRHEHVGPAREWMPEERQFAASVADHLSLLIEASRRVRAEAALEQQRAFLRLVIDLNPSFIFAKDREGRFTLVNQAVADAYGSTVEDLVGKTDADFNPNAEEVAHFRRIDLDVLDTGRERFVAEEVLTDAQGRVRYLQTVKRPIVEADGRANQVLGVSTDISERKRAEEERARLEESLRQAQKIESLGLLAGGIAHDFNNLLTVINGYANLLESQTPAGDPRRGKIVEVRKAGERAAGLTRQLLAFGRRQRLEARVFDLRDVLGNLEKMLCRLIGEDVRLVWASGLDVPRVKADPGQIEQVVMNLVINARDAMPHGGTITVEVTSAVLDETYAAAHAEVQPGRYAVVAVSDTGVGISPEIQPRIFEPFFTTKEIGKGTGLGLATVYGVVKQSGGHISLYSEPGVGTTFKVYLPAASSSGVAESSACDEPAPRGGTETILLVEDEPQVRELARGILDSQGYRVLACADPRQALDVCDREPGTIDLMLTDVVMPGMNGPELHERLLPHRPRMRVIYMSGYTDCAIVQQGTLTSQTAFIQKPFTPGTLGAKVRAVLDGVAEEAA
jgi:PAS domain S-box-containing protein